MDSSKQTLVIRNGTLIDGSGRAAARNESLVVEGNRIKSVGRLPADVRLEDALAQLEGRRRSSRELVGRADSWRPWRAYAAQHLWASLRAATPPS